MTSKHRCELTRDPQKRATANQKAAAIAAAFPPGLARPALRALEARGIRTLTDLSRITADELAALHGIGPRALATLGAAMQTHALTFRRPT